MKLVRWKRFTWELAKLPPFENKLPTHYTFRAATREEAKAVNHVIFTALSLDTAWSDTLNRFREHMETQIEHSFARESVPAVVLTHGQRIIAASVISTDAVTEAHLVSGPCVLLEYHSRGIGSALLQQSLAQLKNAGLDRAVAITKENTTACKFVYPKFGSASAPCDYELLQAAS